MNIKKHIPNAITCCNLLCGCLAIVQAFEGNLVYASYLVILAAIFDFFDGFTARMLKVSSAIGKDLDSLADMVTFGVVPGIVMFKLIQFSLDGYVQQYGYLPAIPDYYCSIDYGDKNYGVIPYFGFLITIFSGLRLAKFNNDTRQTESFIGLNTPANTIFICSIILIYNFSNHSDISLNYVRHAFQRGNTFDLDVMPIVQIPLSIIDKCLIHIGLFIFNTYFLCILSVILSLLLVSEIPMFSLKFKHFKWKGNEIRFIFLALSLLMLITLQFLGIPLIIILYVLLSLLTNYLAKRKVTAE
jgi:CDP-diacylglycerol--serine O-phosphatidyltransferase